MTTSNIAVTLHLLIFGSTTMLFFGTDPPSLHILSHTGSADLSIFGSLAITGMFLKKSVKMKVRFDFHLTD